MSSNRKPGIHIAWTTVTYRSIMLMVLAVAVVFFAAVNFAFPQFTQSSIGTAGKTVSRLLELVAGAARTPAKSGTSGEQQQAHITALDGTVRVKKANSNTWVNADYNIPLEKGDVIQTSSEGMAKVVFGDGTNYTVKQDSLIVIEENSANDQQQTSVAVAVSTGTVDLSTGTYVQGSKSQVIVAGATASLAPESSAMVTNSKDQHEILLKKGAGEVSRNGQVVRLADWEKASFSSQSKTMEKGKEIGPPTPISPANMMPIFSSGESKPVEFSWTPMKNASGYRLKIARNPYFSNNIVDRRVDTADVLVSGLTDGAYYWLVQSIDAEDKTSIESERNRFTIVPKGKDTAAISLDLDPFIQHGHVIELIGKTENGARVMVNGREVPLIAGDGTFRYFTPPLPAGESLITITAQNAQGGVNTVQKKVVIQ